jgi:hypothetical protein
MLVIADRGRGLIKTITKKCGILYYSCCTVYLASAVTEEQSLHPLTAYYPATGRAVGAREAAHCGARQHVRHGPALYAWQAGAREIVEPDR